MLPTLRELHTTLNRPGAREALLRRVLDEARQPAAAHVYTALFDDTALLGMSFLNRTDMKRDGANLVLTKRF